MDLIVVHVCSYIKNAMSSRPGNCEGLTRSRPMCLSIPPIHITNLTVQCRCDIFLFFALENQMMDYAFRKCGVCVCEKYTTYVFCPPIQREWCSDPQTHSQFLPSSTKWIVSTNTHTHTKKNRTPVPCNSICQLLPALAWHLRFASCTSSWLRARPCICQNKDTAIRSCHSKTTRSQQNRSR